MMKAESLSFFDRVAIGFGAMVLGCAAVLVGAFPLLMYFIVDDPAPDMAEIVALLFWKAPILFGLFSGVVGFTFPGLAADGLGEAWKYVIGLWRD